MANESSLDELINSTFTVKAKKQKYTISKNGWVSQDKLRLGYFMFSFNKEMFGFVRHYWFPSGGWEAPESEYDYDYEKGFGVYDSEYKSDVIDEERQMAEMEDDRNAFIKKVVCIPIIWMIPTTVGHSVDGKTIELFKDKKHEEKNPEESADVIDKYLNGWW